MKKLFHIYAVGLLALAYFVTSSALTLSSLVPLIKGKGPEEVVALAGGGKEPPRPVFVQRRHMPLVKIVSLPTLVPSTTALARPDFQHPVVLRQGTDALPAPPEESPYAGRSPPSL